MDQNQNFSGNMMQQLEDQIDLRDLISLLWANKWFIAIVAGICLMLSILYITFKPPQYSANVLLQVEDRASGFSGLDQAAAAVMSPLRQGGSPADVQKVLIKSRYILDPVVQSLGLDLDIQPQYFPLVGEWYARHHDKTLVAPILGLSHYTWGGESLKISEFIVPHAQENHSYFLVALGHDRYQLYDSDHRLVLTGKVGVVATAAVPEMGGFKLMVSGLSANPGAHFSIYKKASDTLVEGIRHKLDIADLGEAEHIQGETGVLRVGFSDTDPKRVFSLLNTLAKITVDKDIEKKSTEATKTLIFLNQQLPIVKKSLDDAELALNNYQAKTGMINLNDEVNVLLTGVSDIQRHISEIQMDRAAALQQYTSLHPVILALNNKEQVMRQQLQALELKISKLPASEQAAVGLMRDVKVKSQLYLILLSKIQALQVSKAGTVSDVRILSLATFPYAPISNNRAIIFLGSFLFGVILGALIVFVKHALHRKLNDPSQIESQFGLTNVAIVPFSQKQKDLSSHNPKAMLVPLLAKTSPTEPSIEALRSFRTSLQFAMLEAKNNIVSIMGVAPGVGKSFVSANFAYLLANAGKKILLIDGDIRKGHLKDYFKVGACLGLSELVLGSCTFEQAVIQSQYDNLDFLATGAYPPNPSELLMTERFKQVLETAAKRYDLVIIDTAPILAVTDAALIGQHAGTNFMVLASNAHEVSEIELALKRVSANGVKINGVVFNFNRKEKNLHSYGYGYRYNYQYKYD